MQHRDDALAVMPVRRRDVDRQREAVFIDREMDLDALDLLATIEQGTIDFSLKRSELLRFR